MNNISIIFVLLLCSSGLGQQSPNLCPLDTNQQFELRCIVSEAGGAIQYWSELGYLDDSIISVGDKCDPYPVEFLPSTSEYKVLLNSVNSGFSDTTSSFIISSRKVRSLTIQLQMLSEYVFDISTLEFFDEIDLGSFTSITVNSDYSTNYSVLLKMNKWSGYKDLVRKNSLTELKIHSLLFDDDFEDQIRPFKNLTKLECREYINKELSNYPIQTLEIAYPYYFFTNQVLELPLKTYFKETAASLLGINSSGNGGDTEKMFFVTILNLKLPYHPLHILDSLVRARVKEYAIESGKATFLASELYKHQNGSFSGDKILASGTIENGELVGSWKYCDWFFDNLEYDYDYSKRNEITFPIDGLWKYEYPDGTTAIEGAFKNSSKEGIWRFYTSEGKLSAVKRFKDDQPRGLFTDYLVNAKNESVEFRTFFLDGANYVQACWYGQGEISLYGGQYHTSRKCYYTITHDGNLAKIENGKIKIEYKSGTKKYDQLLWKHFLKLLYPEYKKGQTPYELNKNKTMP